MRLPDAGSARTVLVVIDDETVVQGTGIVVTALIALNSVFVLNLGAKHTARGGGDGEEVAFAANDHGEVSLDRIVRHQESGDDHGREGEELAFGLRLRRVSEESASVGTRGVKEVFTW